MIESSVSAGSSHTFDVATRVCVVEYLLGFRDSGLCEMSRQQPDPWCPGISRWTPGRGVGSQTATGPHRGRRLSKEQQGLLEPFSSSVVESPFSHSPNMGLERIYSTRTRRKRVVFPLTFIRM